MSISSPSQDERRSRSFREQGSSPLDELIFRLRSSRILRLLPAKIEAAADLGSGYDFRLLRHLLGTGRIKRGVAVDLSLDSGMLPTDAPLRLLESDLNQVLDMEDDSMDVVLSLAVLEHLDRPDVHLREIHRILRPSGRLLLTSPSRSSAPILEFLAYRLRVIDADEIRDHKHYFTEQEIRDALAGAGFSPGAVRYSAFLAGLNQLVVASKSA